MNEELDHDDAVEQTTPPAPSEATAEPAAPEITTEQLPTVENPAVENPTTQMADSPAGEPLSASAQVESAEQLPTVENPTTQTATTPYNMPQTAQAASAQAASAQTQNPYMAEAFRSRYTQMPQSPYNMPPMPIAPMPIADPQYQQPMLSNAGIGQAPPSDKKSGTAAIIVAFAIVLVLMVGVTLFYMFQGGDIELPQFSDRPAVSDYVNGNAPVIELPTEPKPPVEEKYKELDGRYTPQGIAKVVAPSVVGIVTYEQGQNLVAYSEGTGFIISSDGYIMTCAHIFDGAARQKVILDDDTEFIATMVGKDIKSDIAVLKINPKGKDLQTVTIGDSSELELGEGVIAIGNAGGFANSISGGMVSGLDRKIRTGEESIEMNCIQTDAAVNPGNSGGPLVNMFGQVVGIVSSKFTPSALYENIGFAITINEALPIVEDIISKGYVTGRVRVGVIYQSLSDASLAKSLGIEAGLVIADIDPTCDIANTDLDIGDVITSMNGRKVYDADSVKAVLDGMKPGDIINAHVYRKDIIDEATKFDISFKLMEDNTATY